MPHRGNLNLAVGLYQEEGGDVGQAVLVRDRVAVLVEQQGEGAALLAGKVAGVAGIVLGDAPDARVAGAVEPLVDAFQERKRELADRAALFEESQ